MPYHPHSRRQQDYHTYHHPVQPHSPLHHPYANYQYPVQYYAHPQGPPPAFAQQRWHPQYPPQPPHYAPPPPQQSSQPPYPPRSPMVVSSQPYSQNVTPAQRHTPVQYPPSTQQLAPSPRALQPHMQQPTYTPGAPPSPAPTPKEAEIPKQEPEIISAQREATPHPQSPSRRQSTVLPETPEYKVPYYPTLPWYSVPDSSFPPRSTRQRRKWQNLNDIDGVALPPRVTVEDTARQIAEQVPDVAESETSTIAAPSELETPATSQAPSETEFSQVSTPATPAQGPPSPPKSIPAPISHARRDTRTAIAVPNIPSFTKPRQSQITEQRQTSLPSQPDEKLLTREEEVQPGASDGEADVETATPASPSPKPAPKSWADLVRRNNATAMVAGFSNGSVVGNGVVLPQSASLADALKQYSVQIDAKLSFLEPRGLVNTGNMCYMNSILQVLVFCAPFYNFLDSVRQRTVHSMKSDTPLVDAMIMFMKEFRVLASAESADVTRGLLSQQQLEQYGEPVTPEYVYDAIRKLERFISMRASLDCCETIGALTDDTSQRGHQQDAEEFLGFLLEGLHDECVAVMRGQRAETAVANDTTLTSSASSPVAADGWLEVGPKQKSSVTRTAGQPDDAPSPITKIFGGHLRSELRVPGLKDSVTLEPYKPLQLDIGAPHVNNIVDALKGLTRTELLSGDFGGRSNSAKKQVFIDSLPPILILHLKRFQYDNNLTGTQKIWKKVGYPLELEIPKEVFQPSKRGGLAVKGGLPQYRLTSVVYHHGKSAAGGHYTVDVLRQDGREWIRMDDTVIRRIRPEDVAEGGSEEDPKLLAKALEQHKADQDLQKQRNMYQGLDEAEKDPEADRPWSEVNGHVAGHKKWNSIANTNATTNGTATPISSTGKRTPTARKDVVRDNKVAYILLYERIRG